MFQHKVENWSESYLLRPSYKGKYLLLGLRQGGVVLSEVSYGQKHRNLESSRVVRPEKFGESWVPGCTLYILLYIAVTIDQTLLQT